MGDLTERSFNVEYLCVPLLSYILKQILKEAGVPQLILVTSVHIITWCMAWAGGIHEGVACWLNKFAFAALPDC